MISKTLTKLERHDNGDGGDIKVTFRLPKELVKQLKFCALYRDVTVTSIVLRACEDYLSKDKTCKEKFNHYNNG
jgi:hypothetical protein